MPSPPVVLVFLDADRKEGPEQIDTIARPMLDGEADFVLGVRRRGTDKVETMCPHARLGNRLITSMIRLLYGRAFRDLPPFRAVHFGKLMELQVNDRTWGWTLQMQIRAVRQAFRIVEIEVAHGARSGGESKISGSVMGTVRAGSRMLLTLLTERIRRLS